MTNKPEPESFLSAKKLPQMEKVKPDLTSNLRFVFIRVNNSADHWVSYSAS